MSEDKEKALKHSLVFCSRSGGLVLCKLLLCCFLHSVCPACPQGTFKSFQGAGLCHQCPLNSRSTIEAATLCGCRNGYYRGDMDKPEDVCTSESHTFRHTHQAKTHTQHTSVWLLCSSGWFSHIYNFVEQNLTYYSTSAVDSTGSPIFPHWIKGQYLLWFIIPSIILCNLFKASLLQWFHPCFGVWGAVSNNTATILRLPVDVNVCFVCLERPYCYARRGTYFEKCCLSVPQRDGVSRLRHESFGLSDCSKSLTVKLCVYCVSICVCVTWILLLMIWGT